MPRRSPRAETNDAAKDNETTDGELDWAMGLARWTAFESKHGSGIVPDDDQDQQLVRWIKKQRKDYWNWKKGRLTDLEEENFQMLSRFGFDWCQDQDNQVGDDDQPSSETAAKPAAGPTSEGESTDTDVEEESVRKVTRYLRRSTRQVTLPPASEADGEASKPAAKSTAKPTGSRKRKITQAASPSSTALKRRKLPTREVSRKQAPKASKAGAKARSGKATGKAKKNTSWEQSKTYGTKILKRAISPEEEEDVPGQIRKEFAHLLKCDELLEPDKEAGVNIQIAGFNQHWEDRFFELLVFMKTYGHTLVPKVYNENKALGRYVAKMRSWHKTNNPLLTPSRQKRLEAIDFSWDAKNDPNFWRVQNDTPQTSDLWEERFQELLAYKEANGDCMVPKNYPPDQTLARWVSKQRRHFRAKQEGTYHTLDDEKVAKLEEAGFVFETKTHTMIRETVLKRFKGRWDYFFNLLVDFKKVNGHCAVPRRWKPDQTLASWVMRQRFQWKKLQEGSHSYLTEERLQQLKDIDFVFNVDRKQIYPVDGFDGIDGIDGSAESPPAVATKPTGRRAKASTPASELTIDADEEIASSDNEDSDGESDKKPAAKMPHDAVDADREDDDPTVSVPEEKEEEEQTEVQEEESPAASEKGDDDSDVVGEEQASDEEGDRGAADSKIAVEAKAPEEEGSLGALERGNGSGKTVKDTKGPDEQGSLGAPERGDKNRGTVEEKNTSDGADTLLLFAGERRDGDSDSDSDTPEEKTTTNEADALLLLASEKGKNGGGTLEEKKTADNEDNETMDKPVSEETNDSETAGDNLSKLKKGVWTCPVCEKDEFEHFIDAAAHEAACTDLTNLTIRTDTQLD